MAKFAKPPPPPEPEDAGFLGQVEATLAGLGIETGLAGGACVAGGGLLLLVGAVRLWSSLRVRFLERQFEGEVTEYEPGRDGGYHPVVVFTDAGGQRRRFTAPFTTRTDPTGQPVLVREGRDRPEVVPPAPSPGSEAMGLLLPWALGAGLLATGLTGGLLGVRLLP